MRKIRGKKKVLERIHFFNLFRSGNKQAIEFNLIILYISQFDLRSSLVKPKHRITDSSLM